jgi:DNA-binding SARP family transcriptional activator/tetratricopeptide (TPR) repeat protein
MSNESARTGGPDGSTRFRILGPLEVRSGEAWTAIGAPKWRALLAVLLLNHGQVVSTERLVDELWGDEPPARPANLVATYVHRLRGLIGDPDGRVLVTRAPGYRVVVDGDELDALRFARLVAAGRTALADGAAAHAAELLGEALRLFRGQPLADVPFSDLVDTEANRLEESRVAALGLRVEAEIESGAAAGTVAELRRLTAAHPLREEFWALLMRALCAAGRQAEALEAYERARTVIGDELGVDPGPGLRRLHQEILEADACPPTKPAKSTRPPGAAEPGQAPRTAKTAPPPAPGARQAPAALSQLPADVPDFTGRADHVEYLCRLFSGIKEGGNGTGAVMVSLIAGAGGLGKTTLAVHVAHRLRDQFPDGQLYVDLHGASDSPAAPADVLARFLRQLGVDGDQVPASEDERVGLYRTRLAGRRVLIVLDDARDAAQARPLVPGSVSCGVLVTSRNLMPDLVGGRLVDLDVLDAAEARALLARIVGADRLGAEPAATDQLLAACAGLPLAIRIAGVRLAGRTSWTVQSLAGKVADERRRIDEFKAGDLAVRACFQVSFNSLRAAGQGRPDPARTFRLLGLWHGPFISLPAAASLLAEPEDRAADSLEMLVDAHLLQSLATDRYRLHDLLRVYAAEKAEAEETEQHRAEAVRRVLTWYLHTAEAAGRVISPQHARVPLGDSHPVPPALAFASLDQALDWCESARANLVAAASQAASCGMHDIAWKLPAAMMSFCYRRSHWADWVATHESGLNSARALGDRMAEAWMLNNLGMAFGLQRKEQAVGCFEEALAIYREIGDQPGQARAANNVAQACLRVRRFPQALDAATRSLAVQRQAGDRYGEGIALGNLGDACRALARFDEAIGHLEQALDIFRELGDQHSQADALSDLGDVYLTVGRLDDAQSCLRASLAIWRAHGERYGQAATLGRLGLAQKHAGRLAEARELLSEAHFILAELGDLGQAAEIEAELAELAVPAPLLPAVI